MSPICESFYPRLHYCTGLKCERTAAAGAWRTVHWWPRPRSAIKQPNPAELLACYNTVGLRKLSLWYCCRTSRHAVPLEIILTETRSRTLPRFFFGKRIFLSGDKCNDFTVLVKSLWCFRLLSAVAQQSSLKSRWNEKWSFFNPFRSRPRSKFAPI